MKEIIIAKNTEHLQEIIQLEIKTHGYDCDLNHIDTTEIEDMSELFLDTNFNGNISNWNTSNVKNMYLMFKGSQFNGDISAWNVSNVTDMSWMFFNSPFNQDISNWNIKKVTEITKMFNEELNNNPWWYIEDSELRKSAIEKYELAQQLKQELSANNHQAKKMKV